jgi:hypothetical protein
MANQAAKHKLSRDEMQTLYNPGTYYVSRVNESVFFLRSDYTGLIFYAKRLQNSWRVNSYNKTIYDIDSECNCSCPDSLRARQQERLCKHQAVIWAVIDFLNREASKQNPIDTATDLKLLSDMFGLKRRKE